MTANAIRAATLDDARAIARIQVSGWQQAFRGIVPDANLDAMSAEANAGQWSGTLRTLRTEQRVWVAEDGDVLAGFAGSGPSRDNDATPDTAELYAIYADPARIGTGAGRALLAHAVDDLRARGYAAVSLWTFEANARARRFYEAAGWGLDGATKTVERGGVAAVEVRYRVELR